MEVLGDNDPIPMALVAYVNTITTSSREVNEKAFTYVGRIGVQNLMRGSIRAAYVSKAISPSFQTLLFFFVLLLLLMLKWNHMILGVLWDSVTKFQAHVPSHRSTFRCYSQCPVSVYKCCIYYCSRCKQVIFSVNSLLEILVSPHNGTSPA